MIVRRARARPRPTYLAASITLGSLLFAGCGSSDDPLAGATKLSFKLTDAGCDPGQATAPAGPVTFDVTNDGAAGVTELELLDGDSILGEREHLSDGLSGNFTVTLDAGTYTLYCPGGDSAERGTLTVTGQSMAGQSDEGAASVDRYRRYIEGQTALLVDRTVPLVRAVRSGDVEKAKSLYPDAAWLPKHTSGFRDSSRSTCRRIRGRGPVRLVGAGRPEAALLLAFLLRSPDLLAGLGLLQRDRIGLFGDQLEGAAHPQVLLEELLAPRLADVPQGVLRLGVPVILVAGRDLERLEHVLLGDLDPLGLGDCLQNRLATSAPAQRPVAPP